ncbi:hypothetical protein K502DRAFT_352647 [Neoconidiobolus thromboides FSU 785]|nr:hypothetical protein K502DRAFT_352647 [Neoconidiobolus thromboides FSU 785]
MVSFLENEVVSSNMHPVTYEKKKGRLYFTSERIAYVYDGEQEFAVSIEHGSIVKHLATSDNAKIPKIKIETDSTTNKEFVFSFGYQNGVDDKNVFKQLIQQYRLNRENNATMFNNNSNNASTDNTGVDNNTLNQKNEDSTMNPTTNIPLNKERQDGVTGIDSMELRIRASILSKNNNLAKLHQKLVLTGIISEEEFWENRKVLLNNQQIQLNQSKAQSSAWLDLKPNAQDGNEIKYTITPDIINEIFLVYPSVKSAYEENVPDKINEIDFWKRFFASKYFHRNRSNTRINLDLDDPIFDPLLDQDDQEAESLAKKFKSDSILKSIDLNANEADHEEFGNQPDQTMIPGRTKNALSLIRRFNFHSNQILNNAKNNNTTTTNNEDIIKKELIIEDLNKQKQINSIPLQLRDNNNILNISNNTKEEIKEENNEDYNKVVEKFKKDYQQLDLNLCNNKTHTKLASDANIKFSEIIQNNRQSKENPKNILDSSKLNELKTFHLIGVELLTQYWSTVNQNTNDLEKEKRMIEALNKVRRDIIEVVRTQQKIDKMTFKLSKLVRD